MPLERTLTTPPTSRSSPKVCSLTLCQLTLTPSSSTITNSITVHFPATLEPQLQPDPQLQRQPPTPAQIPSFLSVDPNPKLQSKFPASASSSSRDLLFNPQLHQQPPPQLTFNSQLKNPHSNPTQGPAHLQEPRPPTRIPRPSSQTPTLNYSPDSQTLLTDPEPQLQP